MNKSDLYAYVGMAVLFAISVCGHISVSNHHPIPQMRVLPSVFLSLGHHDVFP